MSHETPFLPRTPPHTELRRAAIVAFYVLVPLSAASEAANFSPGLTVGLKMYASSSAMMWMFLDARRRGRPILWGVQLVALITYPASWILYLIATRGWRGVGWIVVNVVAGLAVYLAAWYAVLALYGHPLRFY